MQATIRDRKRVKRAAWLVSCRLVTLAVVAARHVELFEVVAHVWPVV